MIDILIKSTVCLATFLVFYHLVLEREKMHHFNRFYLLISVVISLLIPFLTYEIIETIPLQASESIFIPNLEPNQTIQVVETINYILILLWSV